jgi:hypothetical protein
VLKTYRAQYIVSGLQIERFQKALASKISVGQLKRVQSANAPLIIYTMR